MMNKINQLQPLNSKLFRLLLSGLLVGLPALTTIEARADMHDMSQSEMESNDMESEMRSPEDNTSDGGSDGEPVTSVMPSRGTVNVRLKNDTNAAIDYQAVGYTENQTLEGGEKHTMVNLPVPVVIRTARQDDGFVKILPLTDEEQDGVLEVSLEEDPEFYDDDNIGVLRIEDDGSVYVK